MKLNVYMKKKTNRKVKTATIFNQGSKYHIQVLIIFETFLKI